MNWKAHPHLFANGKFSAQCLFLDGDQLTGHINAYDAKRNMMTVSNTPVEIPEIEFIIARPIEDMTDKEIEIMLSLVTNLETKDYKFSSELYKGDSNRIFYYEKRASNDWQWDNMVFDIEGCNKESFLYLLSIGVYPFSDTEDVVFTEKQEV